MRNKRIECKLKKESIMVNYKYLIKNKIHKQLFKN